MRTTIDASGRLAVPEPLRDQLGMTPGTELEIEAVDGRLEVVLASRLRIEEGPHGLRVAADRSGRLSAEEVRELMERGRR